MRHVLLVVLFISLTSSGVVLGIIQNQAKPRQTTKDFLPRCVSPSLDYISSSRHVSVRAIDNWRDGQLLPLQKYTSGRSREQYGSKSPNKSTHRDPDQYLQRIRDDVASSNLSKTSASLLEAFESLSHEQKENLVQKIQVEKRATEDVPIEALEILYCDEHICVANKPSGVLSVPGPRRNPSLSSLIYEVLKPDGVDLDQMVVHRLDMATSGVIVYALSLPALSKLHQDFKIRRVQKTYEALVLGHLPEQAYEGEIDVGLERDPENPPFMRIVQPKDDTDQEKEMVEIGKIGRDHKFYKQAPKESFTTWKVVGREWLCGQPVTRVELRPWTGRTHQLRVHCSRALNAPIVGDDIYDGQLRDDTDDVVEIPLCLHARKLCIYHPISGAPMIFETEPPF